MTGYRRYKGRRVLVQIADATLAGRLEKVRRGMLVLTGAAMLDSARPDRPIDGEVVIERQSIQWVQVV